MSFDDGLYHVYTKSISGFRIFRKPGDCTRLIQAASYFQFVSLPMSFSDFLDQDLVRKSGFERAMTDVALHRGWQFRVELILYCVMTTHVHLVVREVRPGALSGYMSDVLNSYSRYFNVRYKRKGPLWQGRFGRRPVLGVDDTLNISAYVHLNPVVEGMVAHPDEWEFSSFRGISSGVSYGNDFLNYVGMTRAQYSEFIYSQIRSRKQLKIGRKGTS